ncbi:transposase [candidate division KSB1 bacterium]|nr:transposase [candidate division KSB1 bacterium]RQW03150.1 MAG: transposase [candidate division KSB1 bacterium]
MTVFDARYNNDDTGCHAYDPKILKSALLGLARGKLSSRKLEVVCEENIIFMALTCCQTPDYSTIATFVSSMDNDSQLPKIGITFFDSLPKIILPVCRINVRKV